MASRTAQLIAQLVDRVSGPAKGMAGALDGVAAAGKRLGKGISTPALDKLTKDLRDAQAQAEKLAQLQSRMKTLGTSRTAFNGARQDVERISRELEAARKAHTAGNKESERAVRELERAQTRARAAVRSAASAFEAEAKAAKRLRRELAALGVPTTSLAAAQSAVATRAKAAAAALEKQAAAEKRAHAAGAAAAVAARAHEAGRPGRTLGPLAGLVGGYEVVQGYKQAAAFDRRLTMIGQTADASREQIDALGGSLGELAQQTATPIDRLTGGLEALVAQGRSLKEAMEFLPSVARTAAATGAEVDDIAKTADSVGSNYGIAGRQMQKAFDIMAAGGKAGQFELKDMARYLPSLGPASSAIGFKGEKGLADLVAMLQVMRKGSGTAEEAVSSMNNILSKMESDKTLKALRDAGVKPEEAFAKARKEGKNLVEVFEQLITKATKGDVSKIGEFIDDMEFKRGVLALMTFKGEWQKLSQTLQDTSGGTVMKDIVHVTKDAQAAITRLDNAWKSFLNSAARAGDAGGISKGLEKTGAELMEIAGALERINKAYAEGGLSKMFDQARGDVADRLREKRGEWLDHYGKKEEGRIAELEADNKAFRDKLVKEGHSPESIEKTMRVRERDLERARRRSGAIDAAKQGLAPKTPLRMGQDPTAALRGETGPIGQGMGSLKGQAFQEAFPVDLSGRKPMPAVPPLPPRRPGSVPYLYNNLEDALGPNAPSIAPKVDTSQVEGAQTKLDELGTKMDEVGQKTIAPPVNSAPVDGIIEKLGRVLGLISQVNSGADGAAAKMNALTTAAANAGGAMGRTGKVATAMSGAFSDKGMG